MSLPTRKLVKTLERLEASSICRQLFADCFCAIHTHELEFANVCLPCEGRLRHGLPVMSPLGQTVIRIHLEGWLLIEI